MLARSLPNQGPMTQPNPRILICDDEPNLRKVLGALLRQQGYEVHAEEDGAAALARVRSVPSQTFDADPERTIKMKKTFVDVMLELPVDATLRDFLTTHSLPVPDGFAWDDTQETSQFLV